MSDSLFSPYWYRAANLHPRLVAHATVSRQIFRGERWYVISSPHNTRQFRVNQLGYELVGRLDGRRSVQTIWETLVRELGDEAPSQDEVLHVLSELAAAGLVHGEHAPDLTSLFDAAQRRKDNTSRFSVLALKVPLFDPTPVLDALLPLARPLMRRGVFVLWLLAVLLALLGAAMHQAELASYASVHALTPANLVMMWLAYPVIKALHELAHGLAVRHWGGEVHEMGATLFLVVPVPYLDASSASAFPEKSRRILVSSMGIIVETAIASLAFALWLTASDGALREFAFACMLIGGVSTVLVNANPLLRYDGYHVLADWLEIPGLAARSDAWLRYLGERWLLGNRALRVPAQIGQDTRRMRTLLLGYGLASWAYRIVLFVAMVGWVAAKQALAGLLLAVFLALRFIALPAWRLLRFVAASPRLDTHRLRAAAGLAGLLVLATLGLGVIPAPNTTVTQGIVWVPSEAQLRNETEGFVEAVLAADGQQVKAGQPLLRLSNPDLLAAREQLQARAENLLLAYQTTLLQNPAQAQANRDSLERAQRDIAEIDRRLDGMTLRSPFDGTLAMPRSQDLPGRFFTRGSLVAQVIPPDRVTVRTALGQHEVDLLNEPPRKVEIRIAGQRTTSLAARIDTQTPAAGNVLASAALGDRGGGELTTDPTDPEGRRTLESFFTLDLTVPGTSLSRIGERAWVRIEHASMPLAMQWTRQLRQAFMQHFGARAASTLGTDLPRP